jgi:hypothetical protein
MRDEVNLVQFPYQIVAERPDDDLPCEYCTHYGAVLVVRIKDRTIDLCAGCASKLSAGVI